MVFFKSLWNAPIPKVVSYSDNIFYRLFNCFVFLNYWFTIVGDIKGGGIVVDFAKHWGEHQTGLWQPIFGFFYSQTLHVGQLWLNII